MSRSNSSSLPLADPGLEEVLALDGDRQPSRLEPKASSEDARARRLTGDEAAEVADVGVKIAGREGAFLGEIGG